MVASGVRHQYLVIKPFDIAWLGVSDLHEIYFEQVGNSVHPLCSRMATTTSSTTAGILCRIVQGPCGIICPMVSKHLLTVDRQ